MATIWSLSDDEGYTDLNFETYGVQQMNGYGAPMMYGVSAVKWNSWDAHTQQLWIQDWNRTKAQATYYQEQGFGYDVAYTYTGVVDAILGTEAVETGEKVNETIEDAQEFYEDAKEAIPAVLETGAIVGVLAAILLLSRGK